MTGSVSRNGRPQVPPDMISPVGPSGCLPLLYQEPGPISSISNEKSGRTYHVIAAVCPLPAVYSAGSIRL